MATITRKAPEPDPVEWQESGPVERASRPAWMPEADPAVEREPEISTPIDWSASDLTDRGSRPAWIDPAPEPEPEPKGGRRK